VVSGVVRSFEPDQGLVCVLLVEDLCEKTFRVRGSDRSTVAHLLRGDPIQFQLARDRRGRTCAIDIRIIHGFNK
jgi:hypothetical protein